MLLITPTDVVNLKKVKENTGMIRLTIIKDREQKEHTLYAWTNLTDDDNIELAKVCASNNKEELKRLKYEILKAFDNNAKAFHIPINN